VREKKFLLSNGITGKIQRQETELYTWGWRSSVSLLVEVQEDKHEKSPPGKYSLRLDHRELLLAGEDFDRQWEDNEGC